MCTKTLSADITTNMDGNANHPYSTSSYNMSDANFGSSNSPDSGSGPPNQSNFELSEFFELGDWMEEDPTFMVSGYTQGTTNAVTEVIGSTGTSGHQEGHSSGESGREKREIKEKVAFKTKSEVEILDDGFKWRKYGKKMVKNSPNPRNYYRCSVEGCPVKKRVERDKEDSRYVITTYEGVHSHQGPSPY